MSLIWSLSGVISYKDETSANFTILKDRYQYFQEGPDVSALPEIVALMADLGLPTKTAVVDPNITDLEFRFSVLDAETNNTTIEVGGASGGYRIRDNNYETTIAALTEDANFTQSFGTTEPAISSVTNFVLESNGLVASFSWTPNATYTTYSEYKIDSGEWISLDDYAVNSDHSFFNFTEIATIGQSIYIRLRFGNGTNYGAWNEEYTVTNPFVLFYGNTLPSLGNLIGGIAYSTEPTLSLSGNNVIIDHPEYVTSFESYQTYDGRFDFTACSNITNIYAINYNGIDVFGCGNLTGLYNNGNTSEFDIDFTGCTSLAQIALQNCNITNLDFLDTILNKSILTFLEFSFNDITTVDLTDFPNLLVVYVSGNANLSSLTLNSSAILALAAYETALTSLDLTDFIALEELNVNDCSNFSSLTLNSIYMRVIQASGTILTSLDLSGSSHYDTINLSGSNISTLTIANGTANDTPKSSYDISDNDLSTTSLNAFFTALGSANLGYKKGPPSINVSGNPGAELCDPTIATEKGWAVFTGF